MSPREFYEMQVAKKTLATTATGETVEIVGSPDISGVVIVEYNGKYFKAHLQDLTPAEAERSKQNKNDSEKLNDLLSNLSGNNNKPDKDGDDGK